MRYILAVLLLFLTFLVSAQNMKIFVSKEPIKMDYEGYLLTIKVLKDGEIIETVPGTYQNWIYFLRRFVFEERVEILKKLKPYLDDYSLCSKAVEKLLPGTGTVMTRMHVSEEKRYTIAVETMFLINWMTFGDMATYLSTIPALYDFKRKKAVSYNDVKSIRKIAKVYKKWIDRKNSGEKMNIFDMFDLESGQIIWDGSESMKTESTRNFFNENFKKTYF